MQTTEDVLGHDQCLVSLSLKACTFADHLVIGTAVSLGQAVFGAVTGIFLISYFSTSVFGALPATSWNHHNETLSLLHTNQMKEATVAYKGFQQKEPEAHIIWSVCETWVNQRPRRHVENLQIVWISNFSKRRANSQHNWALIEKQNPESPRVPTPLEVP